MLPAGRHFDGYSDSYQAAYRTAPNSPINPATDDLGSLGYIPISGEYSYATGINKSGQVVGSATQVVVSAITSFPQHAFRTGPNAAINAADDLGTLGGATAESSAQATNDAGQAMGVSQTTSGAQHAFRTAPNAPINTATDDLGTLGGMNSNANAINNSGQVVGGSDTSLPPIDGVGNAHAFLYMDGVMYDLNDLILSSSGWVLLAATAINDVGQIVATGFSSPSIPTRAFRLDPITASARASGRTCNGTYDGTFNGNITVSPGQTCVFVSGGITGNVTEDGGNVVLTNATVKGNVQVTGGTFSIGPITTIDGNVEIHNIPSGAAAGQVCGVTMQGSLQFHNNSTARLQVPPRRSSRTRGLLAHIVLALAFQPLTALCRRLDRDAVAEACGVLDRARHADAERSNGRAGCDDARH